jgi:hypothetical protein
MQSGITIAVNQEQNTMFCTADEELSVLHMVASLQSYIAGRGYSIIAVFFFVSFQKFVPLVGDLEHFCLPTSHIFWGTGHLYGVLPGGPAPQTPRGSLRSGLRLP